MSAWRIARRAAVALVLAPAALAQSTPEAFVAATEARLSAARSLPERADRLSACRALLAEALDVPALVASTLGEAARRLAPDAEAALVAGVERRIAGECPSLLGRPPTGPFEIYRRRETADGLRLTARAMGANGEVLAVIWTLRPGGPLGWRAVDVIADGPSLAATLRGEFQGALSGQAGDLDAAIAAFGRGHGP